MASLSGTISIALSGLAAQQGALETSTSNIANANTPGYTRRRAVMEENTPSFNGTVMIPSGVSVTSIESLRDRVLELRIQSETQQQSGTESYLSGMSGVESIFSDTTSGIDSKLNAFFNSLQRLSTQPSDTALRQSVLTAADNLSSTFRNVAQTLQSVKSNLDLGVKQSVGQINELLKQVAAANQQVSAKLALGQDTGSFEDQRTLLLQKLSGQMDVQVVQTESGISVTAANGAPLIVGSKAYQLDTAVDATSGTTHVFASGDDITSDITGGQLGGTLRARDQSVTQLITDIDGLAAGIVSALNTAHRAGVDANGNTNQDLFTPVSGTVGAAAGMKLAIQTADQIAASSDGTAGNADNISKMLAVKNMAVVGSEKPIDCYSRIAFDVGSSISNAQSEAAAGTVMLQQLDDQRGAISGVSMDEEAANLIRFQRSYEAAARVISVVNDLLNTAVNLGRT